MQVTKLSLIIVHTLLAYFKIVGLCINKDD